MSRYADAYFISAKRHVTCETVNKSFWHKQSRKLGGRVTFFLPVKKTETFKDKTDTAGDGICRHLFFCGFFYKCKGRPV